MLTAQKLTYPLLSVLMGDAVNQLSIDDRDVDTVEEALTILCNSNIQMNLLKLDISSVYSPNPILTITTSPCRHAVPVFAHELVINIECLNRNNTLIPVKVIDANVYGIHSFENDFQAYLDNEPMPPADVVPLSEFISGFKDEFFTDEFLQALFLAQADRLSNLINFAKGHLSA